MTATELNNIIDAVRFANTFCDDPLDRMWHAADNTWWKRVGNSWQSAEQPPFTSTTERSEGSLLIIKSGSLPIFCDVLNICVSWCEERGLKAYVRNTTDGAYEILSRKES